MSEKIILIGAGNVASHLGQAFLLANIEVIQVYSRSEKKAKDLAKNLHCDFTNKLLELKKEATLLIVAVSDKAIAEVASQIKTEFPAQNWLVVHTSGSIPMQTLSGRGFENVGVFYPLQTFTKGRNINFKAVPLLLEATSEKTSRRIENLAKELSGDVRFVDSVKRKKLHLAAIFVNNFSNHLFSIGKEICEENGLDFSVLNALIHETAEKALDIGPDSAQTGPAVRYDTEVISAHLDLLKGKDNYQKIYKFVSASIKNKFE